MSQQSTRLDSKTGSPERAEGRSKRGPVQMATLSTIRGWMILIAALAILLGAVNQACAGSPALILIITVPLFVVLSSRKHLSLVFATAEKGKSLGPLQNASLGSSRVVSNSSLSVKK